MGSGGPGFNRASGFSPTLTESEARPSLGAESTLMKRTVRRGPEKLSSGGLAPLLQEAMAHHQAGRIAEAQRLYQRILSIDPGHAEALHLFGLLAYRVGQLETAIALIRAAIQQRPAQAPYHFNLGVVLHKHGKLAEAQDAYRQALRLDSSSVEAHCNLGNVLREQGRLEEAVACYQRAVRIRADYVEAHNNLGAALNELGQFDEAVGAFRRALALNPRHAEAHSNLGAALLEQGKPDEAVAAFEQALALKPDYVHARYLLAFALIRTQRPERAVGCLRASADHKHNHGRTVGERAVTASRLKHDAEQVRYLLDRQLLGREHAGYLEALTTLHARSRTDGSPSRVLSAEELRPIAPSFNRILYYADAPVLPQGALNPGLDVPAIEARYHATRPEVMYVDDLLTEPALGSLRAFCLESTIWKKDYENGYIGAFLGDGFACPLLLQIAEELRCAFPGIFKDHPLTQAWAFKYDSERRGLNIHADAAAVNVNFWITPDAANLDPARGGLVVWNKEAPAEWNFKEYNSSRNEPAVREFLGRSGAEAISIPYRQNRAVIFNSDLFHETDRFRFADDYESRRLNITLLYGRRGA
jgi:tetratricopeptide (TPR) repeat protein